LSTAFLVPPEAARLRAGLALRPRLRDEVPDDERVREEPEPEPDRERVRLELSSERDAREDEDEDDGLLPPRAVRAERRRSASVTS
jgi:hypothetical protein